MKQKLKPVLYAIIIIVIFNSACSRGISTDNKIFSDDSLFLKGIPEQPGEDSWKFVEKFPKKDLIILSFGQHSFQRKKIIGSKISKKISKIIITQNRKIETIHNFIEKYNFHNEKIVFIDNKAEFLERIEKIDHKVLTIQMIRNKFEKIARHADYQARNFNEVLRIIKKENLINGSHGQKKQRNK